MNRKIQIDNDKYDIEVWCGVKFYYKKGIKLLHRLDGPAKIGYNCQQWYFEGVLHRVDGPAIQDKYHNFWYLYGNLHRLDGPAKKYGNGDQEWYQNGQLHRLDGPAILLANGTRRWYINGKIYTENEFNITIKRIKKIIDKFKFKLRNKYIQVLKETNICDEKFLYTIIGDYIV